MGLYLLKFPYRKILLPLAQQLKWLHPDVVSYGATVVAVLTGACYYFSAQHLGLLLLAIITIFLRMTMNTIDGVMAIERGNLSLKGEIINALPDRYSDAFLFLGIILSGLCRYELGVWAMASVFLVSYTGMLGKALGVRWQHHGPLGKVERLILLMVFTLGHYLNHGAPIVAAGLSLNALEWGMVLFVVLGQWTVLNRLRGMLDEIIPMEWTSKKQYEKVAGKALVIYESRTGNTLAVAQKIAESLAAPLKTPQETGYLDNYEMVIFCTPNIRAKPTAGIDMCLKLNRGKIKKYALCITYGAPLWGIISSLLLTNYVRNCLWRNPAGLFFCPGYHSKFKTYPGRPNEIDKWQAFLFGIKVAKKIAK